MERDCFELCSGLAPAAIALIATASKSRVLRGDEVCTSSPVEVCQKGLVPGSGSIMLYKLSHERVSH